MNPPQTQPPATRCTSRCGRGGPPALLDAYHLATIVSVLPVARVQQRGAHRVGHVQPPLPGTGTVTRNSAGPLAQTQNRSLRNRGRGVIKL